MVTLRPRAAGPQSEAGVGPKSGKAGPTAKAHAGAKKKAPGARKPRRGQGEAAEGGPRGADADDARMEAVADGAGAGEEEAGDVYEEEDMEVEEPEPAKPKRARKRAQAGPPAVKLASKRTKAAPPRAVPIQRAAEESCDVVGELMAAGAFAPSVPAWAKQYEEQPSEKTAEILTVLLKTCGVDFAVTLAQVEAEDVDRLVEECVEHADAAGGLDMFGSKRGAWKDMEAAVREFWDRTVKECHLSGVLYEHNAFTDTLLDVVLALSKTRIRVFRMVATICGTQVLSAMIHTVHVLNETLEASERQLQAQQGRAGRDRSGRVNDLKQAIGAAQHRLGHLNGLIDKLFQPMVVVRFRDVSADIRAIIIGAVGEWAQAYPEKFLTDHYLKYIAWSLNDSHPMVRQVAVQALRALYADATHLADLEGLSERYMDRFLCLVKDKDDAVALEAVGLLGNLLQLQVIEPEDIEGLEELLMEESPVLRQAAGGLVAETIPTAKNQTEQFRHVLQFCAKILDKADADEQHEDAILLHVLDALGPSLEVLRDWALLGKAMVNESLLRTDADASLLLKVVRAIVKSSCAPAPSGARGYRSKAQRAAVQRHRQQFTSACVKPLVQLVRQCQPFPDRMATLASIIKELKLEVFSLKKQEGQYQKLLVALKDTFLKADSPTVLEECIGTMQHAVASSTGALQDRCREVFNDLTAASLEKLAETARLVTTRKRCDPSDPEDEYVFALNAALLRTLQLLQAGAKDLAESDAAYEVFATLLGEGAKVELAEEALGRVILNVFRILLWNLAALDGEESEAEPALSVEALRGRLEAFVRAIEDVYDATDDPKLRNTVFAVLTDLMFVFSSGKLFGTRAQAAALVPTTAAVNRVWGHCVRAADDDSAGRKASQASQAAAPTVAFDNMVAVARLAAYGAVPADSELPARLLSVAARQRKPVAAVVKQALVHLMKEEVQGDGPLVALFGKALQMAFERFLETHGSAAFKAFKELAEFIAALKPGGAALTATLVQGLQYALRGVPTNLEFLEGLEQLVPHVSAEDAAAVGREIAKIEAEHDTASAEDVWEPLALLKDRVALQAQGGKRARSRKISFANMDGPPPEDSDSESDSDAAEAAAGPADPPPAPEGATAAAAEEEEEEGAPMEEAEAEDKEEDEGVEGLAIRRRRRRPL